MKGEIVKNKEEITILDEGISTIDDITLENISLMCGINNAPIATQIVDHDRDENTKE